MNPAPSALLVQRGGLGALLTRGVAVPVAKESKPVTPRDHEIVALTNKLLSVCGHQNHAVIFAALGQAFLVVLAKDDKELPIEMEVAATALSEICRMIRSLPQDSMQ
jgi:hypothetical protein